jgi:hypothetical protein
MPFRLRSIIRPESSTFFGIIRRQLSTSSFAEASLESSASPPESGAGTDDESINASMIAVI